MVQFSYSLRNKIIFNKSKRSVELNDLADLVSKTKVQQVTVEKLNRLVQNSLVVVCGYGKNPSATARRKRRLVSFGYASGDGVMIGCIEGILIHPDLHGHGLEEVTLRMLMEHLNTLDVGEVCSKVKSEDLPLFTSKGFGSDKDESVLMKLSSKWTDEVAFCDNVHYSF